LDARDPAVADLLNRARPIALVATEDDARALCNDSAGLRSGGNSEIRGGDE